LQRERPLFVNLVLKYLEEQHKTSGLIKLDKDDFLKLFKGILETIFKEFIVRKDKQLDFFYRRQISLFENSYRMLAKNSKSLKTKAKKLGSYHSGFINSHLAHLRLPDNILLSSGQETWFEIYVHNGISKYKLQPKPGEPDHKELKVYSDLPFFNEETLSCMALSMNFSEYFCCFREHGFCYTAFQALINARIKNTEDLSMASLKFNGTDLEVLVNLAFVVSSHANGIEGASFSEWFPYFIQQLSCYSEKTWESPAKIDLSDFTFKDTKIPYMSFNASDWDPQLKEYLIEQMEINLGSFVGSGYESRDMNAQLIDTANAIYPSTESEGKWKDTSKGQQQDDKKVQEVPGSKRRSLKKNNFIVCECKLWERRINESNIENIIVNMRKYNCEGKINLFVVKTLTLKFSALNRTTNANVFRLKKNPNFPKQNSDTSLLSDNNISKYILKSICTGEDPEKVFILIALSDVHDNEAELETNLKLFEE